MDIQALKSTFHGELFEPASAGYDDARQIWNASIDKRPRLIARCFGVADVVAAVNFGRANNLLTAIRGGGHNVGGRALCDDGLVIADRCRCRSTRRAAAPGPRGGRRPDFRNLSARRITITIRGKRHGAERPIGTETGS